MGLSLSLTHTVLNCTQSGNQEMLDLQQKVSKLQITNDRDSFEDITDDFFQITQSKIEFGHIVKSNYFKLIEGTHALEVLNPRLDSSLSEYEYYGSSDSTKTNNDKSTSGFSPGFDVKKSRSIHEVEWVFQNLVKLVDSWFEFNTSLSCNLLSCEYISDILISYKATKSLDYDVYDDAREDGLQMKMLRYGCIGLIQFMKFIINLGQAGVIYEEEDLNIQTMNLDFLIEVGIDGTVAQLESLIASITDERYAKIKMFLQVILSLLYIPEILSINVELFREKKDISGLTSIFTKSLTVITELKRLKEVRHEDDGIDFNFEEMKHCFNNNLQKDIDNFSPPKKSVLSNSKEGDRNGKSWYFLSLDNGEFLFQDLIDMLKIIECDNVLDLFDFLKEFMNFRRDTLTDDVDKEDEIIGHHVITRAILQLFVVRDDKSIMGSSYISTQTLMIEYIRATSGLGSNIFELLNLDVHSDASLSQSTKAELLELRFKFQLLLNNLESPFLNLISTVSQNSSRQRQFKIKELVIWDTLHVEIKLFEDSLAEVVEGMDGLKWLVDDVMPLGLFVYTMKLLTIESIVFKSIELKTSRDLRELRVDYWYLQNYVLPLIQTFLIEENYTRLIELRTNQLGSLNKKYKKCKAGDKKQKLKEEYIKLSLDVKTRLDNLTLFITKLKTLYSITSKMVSLQLDLLNLIYFNNGNLYNIPKYSKASEELLFYLQLKYISSIGVPQQPTFVDYKSYVNQLNRSEINNATRTNTANLIQFIENDCHVIEPHLREKYLCSAKGMVNAIEEVKMTKKVGGVKIVYTNGSSSYFPLLHINQ